MEVKASLKHLRMSPSKVRLVIDLIRKMPVETALEQLKFNPKLAAQPVAKLLNSAIANAINTYDLAKNNLYIKEIRSDAGVTLKRWMPKAHGRATSVRKRGCHISLTVAEITPSGKTTKKVVAAEAPVKLDKIQEQATKSASVKKPKAEAKKKNVAQEEKGKEIVDPRMEGRHGHAKVEGGSGKGFTSKVFRRKSG